MKLKLLALVATCACSVAATYTTSFDGLTAGQLHTQDNWVAQTQLEADGAGNVGTTSGSFIRAQNTTVLSDNEVGTTASISITLNLGAYAGAPTAGATWREGILSIGLSGDQAAQAPTVALPSELSLEEASGNILFKNGGIGASEVLGTAAALANATITLDFSATYDGADVYSVTTGYSISGGASNSFSGTITDAAIAGAADASGVLQALPESAGTPGNTGAFNGLTITDYTFTANAVPEPSSALLLGLGGLALFKRRR